MTLSSGYLFATGLIVCLSVTTVTGDMSCIQCNSTLDPLCQEFFDHNNPNIHITSKPCGMHNARYCIKVTGLWGGIVGTHRFCSSRDLGNQCQDMRFPDHSRKYRGCIYTCGSDGCNAGSSLFSFSVAMVTTLCATVALLWR